MLVQAPKKEGHMHISLCAGVNRYAEFKVDVYQLRPLDRQCQEASNIEEFNGDLILNRHGERG